jgi:hypothetical protein
MSLIDLRTLAERIPLAADRALVEIVNNTETATHLSDHRAGEGFFRRRWSRLTGADRKREIVAAQASARAQSLTVDLVRDLGEHLSFTNLNVALVATRLDELAQQTADSGLLARQGLGEVSELASVVASFMDVTSRRLDAVEHRLDRHAVLLDSHASAMLELERRLVHTELWQASRDSMDDLMRRWQSHSVYRSLPSVCQVLLLARQLAAGKPGEHESATGDRAWRARLADEALVDREFEHVRERLDWRERLPMTTLLSRVLAELPSAEDRLMVAELLGAGLAEELRPPHGPIGLMVARTLERAARRPDDPEDRVIRQAREDVDRECRSWPGPMTPQEFVRWAVDEQAETARAARGRLDHGLPSAGHDEGLGALTADGGVRVLPGVPAEELLEPLPEERRA